VRDSLLAQISGRLAPGEWITKDWDIATDATPEQVSRVFRRVIPTGIEHGTVTVLLDGLHVEVTTLRAERGYADGRRPDQIDFVQSIEEDLARRDFTVNAIAFEPVTAAIIDPFGGLGDLERRRLRAVGEASVRFSEDGLRVLRAARFVATLEFELDPATALAIEPSLDSYRRVSAERIRDEWNKTLRARVPSRGFDVMRRHGLLSITAPELSALGARPTPGGDRLSVALRRTDRTPATLELRLAALLCELHGDPAKAADAADALLTRLRYSNAERKQTTRLIRHQELPLSPEPSAAELRRWLRRAGPDLYRDLCALERAAIHAEHDAAEPDSRGQERLRGVDALEANARAELERKPPLSLSELAIDGQRLMTDVGFERGRIIGTTLEALLEQVLDDPALNTPEELLARARALKG
jgi:tRNA nucleotidyltransferase (CCA-adding enzyme)